ncbi:unnamed protein product [Ectocarpus fasciculatus]
MELRNIDRICPSSGATLNLEEQAGLEVAMVQRKREENLAGKFLFWGKIYGATQDYLIVSVITTAGDFPEKKYYYCTTGDYVLRALPELSEDYESQAQALSVRFTGDPSFFNFSGADDAEVEEEDPEAPPVERFREVHRLSYVVQNIDHDCALAPKGSLVIDAGKRVVFNPYYPGLSFHTSADLRAYYHFRMPESAQGLAVLKKPGIVKADFLDCITKDAPSDIWSVSHDSAGSVAFVRNLYWQGYHFYAAIDSQEYGGAYFGSGVAQTDIAFML